MGPNFREDHCPCALPCPWTSSASSGCYLSGVRERNIIHLCENTALDYFWQSGVARALSYSSRYYSNMPFCARGAQITEMVHFNLIPMKLKVFIYLFIYSFIRCIFSDTISGISARIPDNVDILQV